MRSYSKRLTSFLLLIAISMLNFSNASPDTQWDKLASLENIHTFEMQHKPANKESQKHYIFVKLPPGYDENKDVTYPTLYLLDGDTNFPLFASYYHYLRFMEDAPSMIIVGLSYGSYNWRKGNNRSHDYTAPSKEAEHWGGASHFERFITTSLLPEMKKRFRVDTDKQILFGQSLSGQFSLYAALYSHAPFYAVIASNPALHNNLEYFKQDPIQRANRPKIFITSAEFDAERFKKPLMEWHEYWQKKDSSWQYSFRELLEHNHLSATPESIRLGLKSLLPVN